MCPYCMHRIIQKNMKYVSTTRDDFEGSDELGDFCDNVVPFFQFDGS